MTALLDERQRRQRDLRGGLEDSFPSQRKDIPVEGTKNLQKLVESVKRKSATIDPPGQGKRRRL